MIRLASRAHKLVTLRAVLRHSLTCIATRHAPRAMRNTTTQFKRALTVMHAAHHVAAQVHHTARCVWAQRTQRVLALGESMQACMRGAEAVRAECAYGRGWLIALRACWRSLACRTVRACFASQLMITRQAMHATRLHRAAHATLNGGRLTHGASWAHGVAACGEMRVMHAVFARLALRRWRWWRCIDINVHRRRVKHKLWKH